MHVSGHFAVPGVDAVVLIHRILPTNRIRIEIAAHFAIPEMDTMQLPLPEKLWTYSLTCSPEVHAVLLAFLMLEAIQPG